MNIGFYYGSLGPGGAERVITALANKCIEKKQNVSIYVTDNNDSSYYLDKKVNLQKLNLAQNCKNILQSLMLSFKIIIKLRKLIKKDKIDVLCAFAPKLAVIAKVSTLGLKVKVVGSERTNPYVVHQSFRDKCITFLTNMVDGFIFQTKGASTFYPRKLVNKSIIIPNGIFADLPEYIPSYKERQEFVACATGRLTRSKNYSLIIDAVGLIVKDYPKFTLNIYGDGSLKEEIQDYIYKKRLHASVFLKGRSSDIGTELVRHRLFILGSDYEGMPNGLIEAMACGCVCISSNCDFGPSELIKSYENGILFEVGNTSELVSAIKFVLDHELEAEKISQKALNTRVTLEKDIIIKRYYDYITNTVNK